MDELKQKLESVLLEHQRESGLHMIGGRAKLVERLLEVLDDDSSEPEDLDPPAINGPCVA